LFAENGQNSNDLRSPEQKKEDHEKRGIMQRSFEYIFQCIEAEQRMIDKKGNQQVLQFLVKCSFLEIYNEQIMDLLEPSSVNLQIREDINKGVYVEGLHEEIVGSHQEMFALIERGAKNRHCGATAMNH
jgi:kinesin family protein 15